jgi:hypothetical protein
VSEERFMARANNQQSITNTVGQVIYDRSTDDRVETMRVTCHSTSGASIFVNAAGPMNAGEFEELEPGQSFPYQNCSKITVKVADAAVPAIIGWGAARKA